jgi:AraC-like DNA-binding protein
MTLDLFTLLTIISIFMALILSSFFFVTKKGAVIENKILAILLSVFNLQIFYSFATSTFAFQYFMEWHKPLFLMRQTAFLIGPLIYFYVKAHLKIKNVFDYRLSIHFLPFECAVFFILFYYRDLNQFIIWESPVDLNDTVLILAHNLVYIMLSLWRINSTQISFRGDYKRILLSAQYRWLQILLVGFIIVWMVNLNSFAVYMIVKKPGWCAYTVSIYALVAFIFINTILLALLLKPDVYYLVAKYKNNKLSEPERTEYLEKLNSYMETRKPFLNPEINLETLAGEICVNPRFLSQIINETFRKNFKSYILEYRIRESMQILADSKQKNLTILEILYMVGFNSKSAFNNQFKLFTNLTPIEFRSKAIGC